MVDDDKAVITISVMFAVGSFAVSDLVGHSIRHSFDIAVVAAIVVFFLASLITA